MSELSSTARAREDFADRLRGFGPLGLTAILVILAGSLAGPIASAVLVLIWAQVSETPLQALGFKTPQHWAVTLAGGAVFGAAFKLVAKAFVMPLLGAPPGAIAVILVSASFGEEVALWQAAWPGTGGADFHGSAFGNVVRSRALP